MLAEVHKVLATVPHPKVDPLDKPEIMDVDNLAEAQLEHVSKCLREITEAIEKYSSDLNTEVETACNQMIPVEEGKEPFIHLGAI